MSSIFAAASFSSITNVGALLEWKFSEDFAFWAVLGLSIFTALNVFVVKKIIPTKDLMDILKADIKTRLSRCGFVIRSFVVRRVG